MLIYDIFNRISSETAPEDQLPDIIHHINVRTSEKPPK